MPSHDNQTIDANKRIDLLILLLIFLGKTPLGYAFRRFSENVSSLMAGLLMGATWLNGINDVYLYLLQTYGGWSGIPPANEVKKCSRITEQRVRLAFYS